MLVPPAAAVAVATVVSLAVAGCAVQASEPPASITDVEPPATTPVASNVDDALAATVGTVERDSRRRQARRLTLRLRNASCVGVSTGSGFAITREILITNRHVLAGAETLEVSTWNGRTLEVVAAAVGRLGDIGLARVEGSLPEPAKLASAAAGPGDDVTVVGYPLGGPLTLRRGTVVDRVDGQRFGVGGDVLRLDADVRPGSSGGPVLDARNHVVAVVFALETSSDLALAIPVDTMVTIIEAGGYEPVPACSES